MSKPNILVSPVNHHDARYLAALDSYHQEFQTEQERRAFLMAYEARWGEKIPDGTLTDDVRIARLGNLCIGYIERVDDEHGKVVATPKYAHHGTVKELLSQSGMKMLPIETHIFEPSQITPISA